MTTAIQEGPFQHITAIRFPLPTVQDVAATDGTYTDKTRITWTNLSISGAVTYEVERGTSSSGPWTTLSSSATTPYDDTTGTAGTTYWYRVTAHRNANESAPSAADSGYRAATSVITGLIDYHTDDAFDLYGYNTWEDFLGRLEASVDGFGASQGTGGVYISTTSDGSSGWTAQTIDSWSNTVVKYRGDGIASTSFSDQHRDLYMKLVRDDGAESDVITLSNEHDIYCSASSDNGDGTYTHTVVVQYYAEPGSGITHASAAFGPSSFTLTGRTSGVVMHDTELDSWSAPAGTGGLGQEIVCTVTGGGLATVGERFNWTPGY